VAVVMMFLKRVFYVKKSSSQETEIALQCTMLVALADIPRS
jgi:hypothetical protein